MNGLEKIPCECFGEPTKTMMRLFGLCDGFSVEPTDNSEIDIKVQPNWRIDGIDPRLQIIGKINQLPSMPDGSNLVTEIVTNISGDIRGELRIKIPVNDSPHPFIINSILEYPSGDIEIDISREWPNGSAGLGIKFPRDGDPMITGKGTWQF